MSVLFAPFRLAGCELPNRVVVSPMSQYSAVNGEPTDWHFIHYGALSASGAALVIFESTHVEEKGRGTQACLGLYSDKQERQFAQVIAACRLAGAAKLGLQLNHSGRKSSSTLPWAKVRGPLPAEDGAWQTVSASAIPFGAAYPAPAAATLDDLKRIKTAYVASAQRALRLGFDLLEVHAAHGYFLHSFLSPLGNHRIDEYGGSRSNRMRYPLEVFDAIRAVWPSTRPLGVKVSSTDWDDKYGATIEDALIFVEALKARGCDYVCMSSGAITAEIPVPAAPGYQTQFAHRVKQTSDMPVCAVGLIYDPFDAEGIVASGQADFVAIGRGFLDNPHWAYAAANRLGGDVARPVQYGRTSPKVWPGAAKPDAGMQDKSISMLLRAQA